MALQREGVQQQDHVGVRQPDVQIVMRVSSSITSAIGPSVLCGVGDGYHAARRSCLALSGHRGRRCRREQVGAAEAPLAPRSGVPAGCRGRLVGHDLLVEAEEDGRLP
jgi:hypothetical protein